MNKTAHSIPFETRPRLLGELDIVLHEPGRQHMGAGCNAGIGATLSIYGRPTPWFPGTRETPEEPAGFDIARITLSFGRGEVDITGNANEALQEWIDHQLEDNS